jgi:hypothetical protein
MSDYAAYSAIAPPPWYRWERFPLLPKFWWRPENKYNAPDWGFQWLALTAWTQMSPELGFGVCLTDQGVEAYLRLPYLKILFQLPLFPRAIYQKLWRTRP